MTVTDEAKLFAIRQQLFEMRYKLDASINIINYVFERNENDATVALDNTSVSDDNHTFADRDPVSDLYAGQVQPPPDYTDVDPESDEEVETTECLD
jgi:hypothetical protein